MGIANLWKAPLVNPVNNKALSIPALNPINVYGRVFNFAWFGFFIAFWAWYAFPPLLHDIVMKDLHLTKNEVLNSNIIALVATLLVRVVAGPCCDRFGPRKTFAGTLLIGAVPAFCAGGITNAAGLYAVRFFIGILGGTFVPCQVWTTGFFDKPVVGLANSLTAGFGNSGGGVTYFVMPAIYNSLWQNQGLTKNVAWRVAYVVPGILIVATAVALLLCCPDTPVGKWSDREAGVERNLKRHDMVGVVDVPGEISGEKAAAHESTTHSDGSASPSDRDVEKKPAIIPPTAGHFDAGEAQLSGEEMMETAKGETIRKPTLKEVIKVGMSPQTIVVAACYFCSFGAELAINSILGTWYTMQFAKQDKAFKTNIQLSGDWAAMFGLLNIVCRPLGGYLADTVYRSTGHNVWAKKIALHTFGVIMGVFLVVIGQVDSHDQSTMFGLIAGLAIFLEGGNGINYALVPHVHPYANGVVSGLTGAAGNFGGVIFSIIYRFAPGYADGTWYIGIIAIAINVLVCWIRPIPKSQVGGR